MLCVIVWHWNVKDTDTWVVCSWSPSV